MTNRIYRFLFAVALLAASTAPARADTSLFAQTTSGFGGVLSERDTVNNNNNVNSFDNFTVPFDSTITAINWFGDRSSTATLSSFNIAIYDNAADNSPGTLLYIANIYNNGNEVSLNTSYVLTFGNTYLENAYTDPVNFAVLGRRQYWLSIQAGIDQPAAWYWEASDSGDDRSYQNSLLYGIAFPNSDTTFTLLGNVNPAMPPPAMTPEPSCLLLTGSGLLTLAGAARRKFTGRSRSTRLDMPLDSNLK